MNLLKWTAAKFASCQYFYIILTAEKTHPVRPRNRTENTFYAGTFRTGPRTA